MTPAFICGPVALPPVRLIELIGQSNPSLNITLDLFDALINVVLGLFCGGEVSVTSDAPRGNSARLGICHRTD